MTTIRSHQGYYLAVLILLNLLITSYALTSLSTHIESKSWDYLGHHIGYEVANPTSTTKEPVLLLNGFGVGSFHQHRLIPEILKNDEDRSVYGMDYLGQGRSWPVDCDDGNSATEQGLIYSADFWADQIICFIEEIVKSHAVQKVHLVGNSVGGYLAVAVATKRPDLIASVSLLNATPVWGLNLPGWSGELPPPAIPRRIGRFLFDQIRDIGTIEKYLETAYANRNAFDEDLMQRIRGCTEGKGGHAAFASIMWAPPATLKAKNFYEALSHLECDVLLLFGQDDPWCRPAFAKRMIQYLERRNNQFACRYLQLSNVGHCPNHEAPKAVAKAVVNWIGTQDRSHEKLVDGDTEVFVEEWGEVTMQELKGDEIKVKLIDKLAATFV